MSPIRRVGVVVHPRRPPAVELGKRLAEWADEHGIELRTLTSEQGCVGEDVPCVEEEDFASGLDLVVALGGDGTLLRALGMVLTEQVPALGVNAGRLGFLAEVEPQDLAAALDAVWAGRYQVERRTTLEARVMVDGRSVAAAGAAEGLGVAGVCPSPLPGPAGNLELFLHLRHGAPPLDEAALQAALAEGAALPGAATGVPR